MSQYNKYIHLDDVFYNVNPLEYTLTIPTKTTRNSTQQNPSFQYNGLDAGSHSLTAYLYTYDETFGDTTVSTTGFSLLFDLQTTFDKKNNDLPLNFISPLGFSSLVVPSDDSLEISLLRSSTAGNARTPELAVSFTLHEIGATIY